MGKVTGFLEFSRKSKLKRPVAERITDYKAVDQLQSAAELGKQAARCMDCGIPFCSAGCPVDNVIPDFNDMVYHGQWRDALETLLKTNNFPEFTGRVCPAPCERACVLDINDDPVSICQIERSIVEKGFEQGWIQPQAPPMPTGFEVAIVGSGPAGLAAAQQLRGYGHAVTVFDREQRPGGLLTYGIPDFKLEKSVVERRIRLLEQEGVRFVNGVNIGVDITAEMLEAQYDAICLCCGAEQPRDLMLPGRELGNVEYAMDYLTQQNKRVAGETVSERELLANGKVVVVIGGGDTASDCIGTANRQGAARIIQVDYHDVPPPKRSVDTPWPMWPKEFSTSSSQEEGVDRVFGLFTKGFKGSGDVSSFWGTEIEWYRNLGHWSWREKTNVLRDFDAGLVLIAVGFTGPKSEVVEHWGLELNERGAVRIDRNCMTNNPGVFSAGDMSRGASLVVWAIRDGRDAADGIDRYLTGQ